MANEVPSADAGVLPPGNVPLTGGPGGQGGKDGQSGKNGAGKDGTGKDDDGADQFFEDLSSQILIASENGLFNTVNLLYKNSIDELISAASESQSKKETEKFGKQVYELRRLFDEAWNSAPQWWRALYERGLLHFLAIFFSTFTTFYCLIRLSPLFEKHVEAWTCGFGVCGATLQVVYYLVKQINRRQLRRIWIVQCFAAPVLGVILSIAIYLTIKGGLMVFGEENDKAGINEKAIAIFCLYAGYKWKWALDKMDALVGSKK